MAEKYVFAAYITVSHGKRIKESGPLCSHFPFIRHGQSDRQSLFDRQWNVTLSIALSCGQIIVQNAKQKVTIVFLIWYFNRLCSQSLSLTSFYVIPRFDICLSLIYHSCIEKRYFYPPVRSLFEFASKRGLFFVTWRIIPRSIFTSPFCRSTDYSSFNFLTTILPFDELFLVQFSLRYDTQKLIAQWDGYPSKRLVRRYSLSRRFLITVGVGPFQDPVYDGNLKKFLRLPSCKRRFSVFGIFGGHNSPADFHVNFESFCRRTALRSIPDCQAGLRVDFTKYQFPRKWCH